MEDASTALPATAWAVLGLLSFGRDLSGYDCKKWADASLAHFYWSPAISQIYRELRRLEAIGYVECLPAVHDEPRNRRLYRITEPGRQALADWVQHSPVERPVLKHGVILRVWLGHLADRDDLRQVVVAHRDHAARMVDTLAHNEQVTAAVPGWTFPTLAERWSRRYYESERRLAEELLADLDEMADENGPTTDPGHHPRPPV